MAQLHIVGCGAIGSLLAAGAEKHNVNYSRYPRSAVSADIPGSAVWLDGKTYSLNGSVLPPQSLSANDVLIIPLKVYQLEEALTQWLPFLNQKPVVVLLHNGMGGQEIAQSLLGDNYPLLLATTSHGALKKHTNRNVSQVIFTGSGSITIGSSQPESIDMVTGLDNLENSKNKLIAACDLLTRVLPPVTNSNDILYALWSKLAVNAVINPLTALNDVPNRAICDECYSELRHQICQEFVDVAASCGQRFDLRAIKNTVLEVATATGNNFSSMHQDIKYKRQTEIDAINGYIVTMANKKGISASTNALLVQRVKALSANTRLITSQP